MTKTVRIRLLAAAVVGAAGAGALGQSNTYLRDWSLISFGNATITSNNHGRALIGGTLSGGASDFGTRLLPASNYLSTDVLAVAGAISVNNVNMQAGNIRHGSTISGNTNFNGGGRRISDGVGAVAGLVEAARVALTADATYYRNLQTSVNVSPPTGQPTGFTFNAAPSGALNVAAFRVPTGFFANNSIQSININLNGASAVLINVPGTSIDFTSNANFVTNFVTDATASRVVWNFFEATSVNLRGKAFFGSILAPLASLSHQGVITGSVAVASINQQSEIHLPSLAAVIPAPGAGALVAAGVLAAGRRRR